MGVTSALALYTTWVCLSCMWALNTHDALYQSSIQLVCLAFVCAIGICHAKIKLSVIQRAIVVVGTVVGAYGLAQYMGYDFVTISWKGNVPVSTIGNPNFLACFLIACIPATMSLVRTSVYYMIPLAVQVLCLMATGCRGAWVGLACGLIAFEKRVVWLVCLIALPLMFMIVQPDMVKSRLDHGGSIYGRITLWQNTLEMVKDYPFLGVGIGNYQYHYPKYMLSTGELNPVVDDSTTPRKPHSWLLQILSETGPIGLLLWVLFLISVFKASTNYLHRWVVVGILAILVHGLFCFPQDLPEVRMLFYLFVGLIGTQASLTLRSSNTEQPGHSEGPYE